MPSQPVLCSGSSCPAGSPASLLHLILVRQLPVVFNPAHYSGVGDTGHRGIRQRGRQATGINCTARVWFDYFFRFLYLFQQLGNLPPHPTGQHGVDGNGKSRRFHVATLLHSRHATTNGCHDSFTAILHHRTRLVLYRQRSIARSLFRLPENHYETDRGSYHSFIATSYFRHFPKHDG